MTEVNANQPRQDAPPSATEQDAPPSATENDLTALWTEVNKLKTDVSGLAGWGKRWGPLLAIIMSIAALCFSVGFQIADRFWTSTDVKLYKGEESPLSMAYDPNTHTLQFTFDVGIGNSGKKDGMITEREATLTKNATSSGSPGASLRFAGPDFRCYVQSTEIDIPFPVTRTLPTTMNCSIVSEMSKLTSKVFDGEGVRHLKLTFQEDTGLSHTVEFCFSMSSRAIDDFFGSNSVSNLRFLNPGPPCE